MLVDERENEFNKLISMNRCVTVLMFFLASVNTFAQPDWRFNFAVQLRVTSHQKMALKFERHFLSDYKLKTDG